MLARIGQSTAFEQRGPIRVHEEIVAVVQRVGLCFGGGEFGIVDEVLQVLETWGLRTLGNRHYWNRNRQQHNRGEPTAVLAADSGVNPAFQTHMSQVFHLLKGTATRRRW